jgi:hypothetical protein
VGVSEKDKFFWTAWRVLVAGGLDASSSYEAGATLETIRPGTTIKVPSDR